MYQIVFCTCPSDDIAKLIATALVKNKLAACVNVIPNVVSVYQWDNQIMCDNEVKLVIKSTAKLFPLIESNIKTLHPYDTPEIIAMNIQQGNEEYLHWINESTKS
jgi:periplasmic divalent cation tolerance protein